MKRGTVDLSRSTRRSKSCARRCCMTFPDCTTKTVEELRKPKLDAWNRNKENSRWLALNMVTEARAGFTGVQRGAKDHREVDFIKLRQKSPPASRGSAPARRDPAAQMNDTPLKVWLERDGAVRLGSRAPRPTSSTRR